MIDDLFPNIHEAIRSLLAPALPAWLVDILMIVIAISFLAIVLPGIVMSLVYLERRVIALMQDRLGPNRVGPLGLLQPIADVLKLLGKEDIVPSAADAPVYKLATVVVLVPALLIYAVIPFSEKMIIADLNIGILYLVAISSTSAVGILMAGWGIQQQVRPARSYARGSADNQLRDSIGLFDHRRRNDRRLAVDHRHCPVPDRLGRVQVEHPDPTARFPNLLHRSNRRAEPNAPSTSWKRSRRSSPATTSSTAVCGSLSSIWPSI